MKKVITYGTYDLLHQGHINLLKRAKELGDYLIVGVTSEDFDRNRGKINVQQTLAERIQAVKDTGYADLVIPEEYFGQKIDDIRRYGVDIFTVGSDWEGHFDYLKQYCDVVYLDRTKGISSTEIRNDANAMNLGIIGDNSSVNKFISETKHVSGVSVSGLCPYDSNELKHDYGSVPIFRDVQELLDASDSIYVVNAPNTRFEIVSRAIEAGKNVIVESPIALSGHEAEDLFKMAEEKGVILFEALKTAYALAFSRMLLLVASNHVGKVRSIESTCTSLAVHKTPRSSLLTWGSTAALPILSILGHNYRDVRCVTAIDEKTNLDTFTRMDFVYDSAVASFTVGTGMKSEGDLVIAGTEGYIYVPSPWWKTDYFEIRREDFTQNRRYFYQLDGEGIRFEIAAFSSAVRTGKNDNYNVTRENSIAAAQLFGDYLAGTMEKTYLQ